ncbi:MAG: class I SAM-dependent methyltransferase [Hyphomonadaceae bacterium]
MTSEVTPPDFTDIVWLFTSNNSNRGVLRQNLNEAALLWKAARASSGPILEIGRRHGGSTVLLATACPEREITSIDLSPAHNQRCEDIFQQIAKSDPNRLNLVVGDSRRSRDGERFGLMFIDGDHTYEGVKADVVAHWSELETGSPAVFHDAVPNDGLQHEGKLNHHEGVKRVCEELIAHGCAVSVASAGSSLWLEKRAELPEGF